MRSTFLAAIVVATLLHCVLADYPPCTSETTCRNIGTQINEQWYCCPGSGNYLDYDTKRCGNPTDCSQPAPQLYADVAWWNGQSSCPGTASYNMFALTSDGNTRANGNCGSRGSVFGATASVIRVRCDLKNPGRFTVLQYATMQECTNGGEIRFITVGLDASCYNINGGSVSVVCMRTEHDPQPTSVTSPAMHTETLIPVPYTVASFQHYSQAAWHDAACGAGSGYQFGENAATCLNFPYSGYRYKIACASKTISSAWNLTQWVSSTSCAGTPASVIRGAGVQCTPTAFVLRVDSGDEG